MNRHLEFQFRQWAESAVSMRESLKLHVGDAETTAARQKIARNDAQKARFYFAALKAGAKNREAKP